MIKIIGTVVLVWFLIVSGFAQENIKFAETITAADLKQRLEIIASDEFEGRETGQLGQKKAAAYIQEQFKSFGYSPIDKLKGYYQSYDLQMTYPDTVDLVIGKDTLRFMKEMYYFPGFGNMRLEAQNITYLGYGIKTVNYDDYKGKDVKDRVLLISSDEPRDKNKRSWLNKEESSTEWTSDWNKKIDLAKQMGVKALLIIDDNFSSSLVQHGRHIKRPLITVGQEERSEEGEMPVIYISSKTADKIFSDQGLKRGHEQLEKEIARTGKPISLELSIGFELSVRKHKENLVSENVLAYLGGTEKKDELVIVTAHYDHLGKKGEVIYNGADDDGSGTSSLLELAEAFALASKAGEGPKRSMLFMAVSGEEKGLLGSEFYTDNPVFPLSSTIANLNIDMIGRIDERHAPDSNYVYIIGSDKLSTELHDINERMNSRYTGLELDYTYNDERDPNRFYYRSDHYNFAKNNIPVIFYFTGVHEDYHQPTDTVDKIMFTKTEKIARLIFYTAWELANRDSRIKVDVPQK